MNPSGRFMAVTEGDVQERERYHSGCIYMDSDYNLTQKHQSD